NAVDLRSVPWNSYSFPRKELIYTFIIECKSGFDISVVTYHAPRILSMEFCGDNNSIDVVAELNHNNLRSQQYFNTMNKLKFSTIGKIDVLLAFLLPLLVFIILARTPQDADMWWHLRAGQDMWQSKSILLTDTFSYTRYGQPWVNAFWISEIIFYLSYKLGEYLAITALVALTGATTFYYLFQRMEGNKFVNAFIIILATITAAPIWSPRPQIFSFLILALLDGWLNQIQKNNKGPLWILILVFALWANIHGGWIWGFLLLAAYIVGIALNNLSKEDLTISANWKFLLQLIFWSLLAGLAIGLNPNGISIWRLPFTTANVSMQIQEWASPDFHQMEFQPLLWMLFLLLVTAVLAKPKMNWVSLLKIIGFAYLTFVSERSIAVFAIIAAPTLAEWTNGAIENIKANLSIHIDKEAAPLFSERINIILNATLLVLIVLTALGRVYLASTPTEVNKNVPVGAVEWLKENKAGGHLFNSYNWGGYLAWSLPQSPVFIDGRADLFGNELINDWWNVVDGTPQGFAILDQWKVQTILLEPSWPIIKLLPSAGWREVYQDQMAVIFIREK
ncbi:MAG: hypothetical protein WCA79_15100, partial [Anaerolineales bacterium]